MLQLSTTSNVTCVLGSFIETVEKTCHDLSQAVLNYAFWMGEGEG